MKINKKRYLIGWIVSTISCLVVLLSLDIFVFHRVVTKQLIIMYVFISLIDLCVYLYDKKKGPPDKRFIEKDEQ